MAKSQLHPGARWQFRINAYLSTLFPIIFLAFFFWSLIGIITLGTIFVIVITILAVMIIFGEFYSSLAYNRFFYEFTDTELKIERGIIWKKYSNIPYERVQNVDVTRGVIARLCGFSTVNIQTAGYGGYSGRRGFGMMSEGFIPAVSVTEAEKIREFVMKKITGKNKRSQGL